MQIYSFIHYCASNQSRYSFVKQFSDPLPNVITVDWSRMAQWPDYEQAAQNTQKVIALNMRVLNLTY